MGLKPFETSSLLALILMAIWAAPLWAMHVIAFLRERDAYRAARLSHRGATRDVSRVRQSVWGTAPGAWIDLSTALRALSTDRNRGPTCAQIAAYLGVDSESIIESLERMSRGDAIFSASGLLGPSPRDRWLVDLRFRRGLNQIEIAQRLGVSPLVVAAAVRGALGRLGTPAAGGALAGH